MKYLVTLGIICCYLANISLANNVINITEGVVKSIPIAINDIECQSSGDKKLARKITQTIKNDLYGSGVYKILPNSLFIENKIGTEHIPLFASWQQINVNF